MGCEIEIAPSGRYVIVKVTGEMTNSLALHYNLAAHQAGRAAGLRRYLMDLTGARNNQSAIDQYEFAYQDMPAAGDLDRTAIVALLVDPSDHSHDFVETVARNTGQNVTLFRDREAAEKFIDV